MPNEHELIKLNHFQEEALIGSMLGDGHLSLNGKNALYRVLRSSKDDDYLSYESNIFINLLAPSFKNLIKYSSYFDKRTNKKYDSCYFATQSNPVFTEYHNAWYKITDDKYNKTLPNNLNLSSVSIAHWLADDGTISNRNLPYRFLVRFATDGFLKDEVVFLAELLKKRYNEEFVLSKKGNKLIISAYDSACRVMFLDIDSSFKMKRKRLWDYPQCRFYDNIPERQFSSKKSYLERAQILNNLILLKKPMTMLELSNKLNYWVKSKKQPNYKLINKLLKPYLDANIISKDVNNNIITIRFI